MLSCIRLLRKQKQEHRDKKKLQGDIKFIFVIKKSSEDFHCMLKGFSMAERSLPSQITVSLEEALRIEIIINQALIDILIAKKIISEEELVASIQKIKCELEKLTNRPNNIVLLKKQI